MTLRSDDYEPSRTSRWYACRYHRTCRSSLSSCELRGHAPGAILHNFELTACGCRLAGIDVADNDDVDVGLLLTVSIISRYSFVHARHTSPNGAETYPMIAVVCWLVRVVKGAGLQVCKFEVL